MSHSTILTPVRAMWRECPAALLVLIAAPPALGQEIGENRAWQFETPQDLAARTATLELIARHRNGAYAAPVYNTQIARQYNCSVSASATGNSGAQSAVANSPTVTGASSTATGNAGTSQLAGDGVVDLALDQRNLAPVGALAVGATAATANGPAWQALNSVQSNGGDQRARVDGSTACGFGMPN